MRKIVKLGVLATSMLLSLVMGALPALAVDYPPTPPAETEIIRGPAASEVAFTGSDIVPLIVAVAALLVVGVSALLIARRRAATAS